MFENKNFNTIKISQNLQCAKVLECMAITTDLVENI